VANHTGHYRCKLASKTLNRCGDFQFFLPQPVCSCSVVLCISGDAEDRANRGSRWEDQPRGPRLVVDLFLPVVITQGRGAARTWTDRSVLRPSRDFSTVFCRTHGNVEWESITVSLSLSLRFNSHFPDGPGLAGTRMPPYSGFYGS